MCGVMGVEWVCVLMCDVMGVCSLQIYELLVVDTKPDKAVSIIECDMKVSS